MSRESLLQQYPLIRFMEWLVLDLLGQISEEDARRATYVVSTSLGHSDWRKGIREMLATDSEEEGEILELWDRFVQDCGRQGVRAEPRMFAQGYSDEWGRIQIEARATRS